MSEKIGVTAGEVWHFLKGQGTATASQITRETGVDSKLIHQAIGWLAREGKLNIDRSGRTEKYSLRA